MNNNKLERKNYLLLYKSKEEIIDMLLDLEQEKQELIDYLKEKIKEQNHKLKILDFGLDIVHAKSKIMTYEEILSKIEKR